ncbi:hypothetical protein IST4116A_02383 [Burkholderia cenocepacia]|uniref:Uncharacterized protein n=1 Tax=Burkholderia phage AP3 TaxID=1636201 RepID=A0A1S5NV61_9CAUD|nr:hypothetical protein [Burkholderia cenocepacia]YP_009785137.1 hypothetical protein HOR03_gp46 [Burkholderia phage AP3]AKA61167.1 hypothetical protein vB_BceM_AP3_0046 [Burkholderia phage AP3]CAB5080430.1 hypothetical protein IST4129_02407 [Burkholderia cenocepacia]CAB5090843.1 hypothetical protein IST4116A_02383 [Burkholderia cenocepacia]CAB5094495.1 hypothetical protein IST4134_04742 [Burkholderia cenocepacia]CAB5096818.1 hypothetical protein IST4131_02401 [Burkholderia cenocepacia]
MTSNAKQSSFQFVNASYREVLFTIHCDGRITIADHLTVDDAAREFWNAVRRLNPLTLPLVARRDLVQNDIDELRAALASGRSANVMRLIPDVTTNHREQRVRIVVGKLMSHHGYAQTNPDQDVLKLRSPRARAWISLANAIVDALFPGKEG